MKKITVLATLSLLLIGQVYSQAKQKKEVVNNTEQTDHYTFQLRDKVTRKAVTFKNRYGITVSGDLYTPNSIGNQKLAAFIERTHHGFGNAGDCAKKRLIARRTFESGK